MWSCMADIDVPRSVWAWRAQWLVPGEKPSLLCRWPQLCHIGTRSILLCLTLPCAGPGKCCSCGESHSRSVPFPPFPHTYTQANKLLVSRDVYLHLWTLWKTNCHQKATYGPLLMGHISWALTDIVSQMAQWFECFAPLFELRVELLAKYKNTFFFYSHNFQYCIVVISSENGMALVFASSESQGQLKDKFSSIENHNTPLFMHVGRWRTNSYLKASPWRSEFSSWVGRGGQKKMTFRQTKALHWGTTFYSDKQQHKYRNKCRLAAKHAREIKLKQIQ